MYFQYAGTNVFYERREGKKDLLPVVMLHGWGCSHKTLQPIFNYYATKNRTVIAVDFPPFGKSESPPSTFTIDDYASLVQALLSAENIETYHLFCHSFGARVGAILGQKPNVRTMVITGGAGVKPHFSLARAIKIRAYKIKKRLGLKMNNVGSADYKTLSDGMKKVFVSVVNRHLDEEFKNIKCDTLLLWGDRDNQTPLYQAKRLKRYIKKSELRVMKGCGHFAFLEDTRMFVSQLNNYYNGVSEWKN